MDAQFVISAARPEQFPAETLPEIAFLGRSNVGKSSLLNCLTGSKGLGIYEREARMHAVGQFLSDRRPIPLRRSAGIWICPCPEGNTRQWKQLIEQYLLQRQVVAALLLDPRRASGLDG